jgi:hypothetical protein
MIYAVRVRSSRRKEIGCTVSQSPSRKNQEGTYAKVCH